MLELYIKNNVSREYTSIWLFREIQKKFKCSKVLYPGSYVHITPSLIFSDVTYVDSFKNTYKFYEDREVKDFVDTNKEYKQDTLFRFHQQNYANDIPEDLNSFDLIISQYWGFVWQDTKKYLKKSGLLVCNNSHWDATMASLDSDYKLVWVYNRKTDEKFTISDKNLENYLIPKKTTPIIKEEVQISMKWIGYTKSPSGYVFKKIK